MKHAFCVLAYRESPFLESCVASLVTQRQRDSEILITTSTPCGFVSRIAAEFNLPLRVNPERADIGADWNFALTASDADYVTLAHQDDLYRPEYAGAMRELMDHHADLLMAFTDFEEHTVEGPRRTNVNVQVKRALTRRAFGSRETICSVARKRRLLALGNPVCCPSVVINRSLLPDFRFTRSMASNLDWEAWSRMADLPGSFGYLRQRLVSKMVHTHSETSISLVNRRRHNEDRLMFERFWPGVVARAIAAVYRAGYTANRV